ncbi:hypothetical protein C0585_04325 [Candidatus Woesearchaeota archaeon]|nr:MAG: hypothetical protein C0585_04325 [Candidatus Woesearchaeota archaeon]
MLKKFFKCNCGKNDGENLIQSILKNKELPIEIKLFKLLKRDVDLLMELKNKKENKFGVTEPQMNVLWVLKMDDEKFTQADLSKKLNSSKANMSTLIDRMEKQDLIERVPDPNNKKVNNIILTKIGEKKIEEMFPSALKTAKNIFRNFTKEEKETLLLLLDKLRGNLNENL